MSRNPYTYTYNQPSTITRHSPPSSEMIRNANFGEYPLDFQKIIKRKNENVLFDPYSAQYKFDSWPSRHWMYNDGEYVFGYKVFYNLNAKNKFGAYIGNSLESVFIKNRRVIYDAKDLSVISGRVEGVANIYVYHHDRQWGPYTFDKLLFSLKHGMSDDFSTEAETQLRGAGIIIKPDDLAWKEGLENWVTAREILNM